MGNFGDYQREEVQRLTPGNHRVVITNAEETISKSSGNPMIVIEVQPNGGNIKIKNYLVKNEHFNRNATSFFDSFPEIKEGDFNTLGWIGAVGAAKLAEDENGYLKVRWFLSAKQAEKLPPWQGEVPERNTIQNGFEEVDDGENDLPFD